MTDEKTKVTNENTQSPKKEEKKERARIKVERPEEFAGELKTNILTSVEMADIVSALFAGTFQDYYGCQVRIHDGNAINPMVASQIPLGAIYVDLYFRNNGPKQANGPIKSLYPIGNNINKGDSLASKAMRLNNRNAGRTFRVTKETYEILSEFMFANMDHNGNVNVNWNAHTQEVEEQSSFFGNKAEAVVCISGLSLEKIVGKIYGYGPSYDPDKNFYRKDYEYSVVPTTLIPGRNREFILQIVRLEAALVDRLQRTLGGYGNSFGFHKYNPGVR